MSDPVTNIEIEDVLSSIRRLVAETERPQARAAPAPDRLVLSPALRVTDPVLRMPPREADAEASAAEAEASASPHRNDASAATHRNDASAATHRNDASAAIQRNDASASPHRNEASAATHRNDASAATHRNQPPAVAALAAVLEAALAERVEEWEPDGSEVQPVMDWSVPAPDDPPVRPARDSVTPPLLTDAAPEHGVDDHSGSDDELGRDLDQALGSALSDRIATLGAAQGLDEATLRTLVVEVVRDELQGALGERITRNVRKLVRREIFRVLSSQEFD